MIWITSNLSKGISALQIEETYNGVEGRTSKTTGRPQQRTSTNKIIVGPSYICYRCNKPNHHSNDCKYKTYECEKCSKIGHLGNACKSRTNNQQPSSSRTRDTTRRQVNAVSSLTNRVTKTVTINGKPIQLTLDTDAQVSLISTRIWSALGKPKLETPSVSLTVADGRSLKVLGTLSCTVKFNNFEFHGESHVSDKCELFGLDWIKRDPQLESLLTSDTQPQILQVERRKPSYDSESLETARKRFMEECMKQFPEIFSDGLGKCKNFEAKFSLKDDIKPTFRKARPVAYALLPQVVEELERMQKEGVIEAIDHSDFATPVVIVKKKNGTIRMCADYSTGLNKSIEDDVYPLPTTDAVFAQLNGGHYFSQIDLAEAYLQVPVEEKSQKILSINTVKGLFKVKRLPFGIKTAPSQFQSLMDTVTAGLPGRHLLG
ncbi:uncharacterized protein K02A2.6-like [Galendromus occidentalis]|uniref:Uncharacterized protein K02A2.6-like n=1 Tax=Galendromus occidentalis TaxID=34638 RepID=A0AAJ7SD97_9ACAR|nr:uncharacterized protein K02A2.6-like [Galendromus occidentalis]